MEDGADFEVAADIGGAFAHAEEAKAAFAFGAGGVVIGVEADTVIMDGQLDVVAGLGEVDGHVPGTGVFLNVAQGFLEDAVEGEFDAGREAKGQFRADELDGDTSPPGKLGADAVEAGDEADVIQDAGVEIARDAFHFLDGPADDGVEFFGFAPGRAVAGGELVHQHLAADEHGAEHLGDGVVQFKGHAPTLNLLHLHHAVRQGPQYFLVVPGLGHVRHHDPKGRAFETIPGQGTNRKVARHL